MSPTSRASSTRSRRSSTGTTNGLPTPTATEAVTSRPAQRQSVIAVHAADRTQRAQRLIRRSRRIREPVYVIKVAYKPEWGQTGAATFSEPGQRTPGTGSARRPAGARRHLRVPEEDGSYRLFSLRPLPAVGQGATEDITASVVPSRARQPSRKYVENCEAIQRPDDAIIPGYDSTAEADIAAGGFPAFQCSTQPSGRGRRDRAERFTAPRQAITDFAAAGPDSPGFMVSARPHSSTARLEEPSLPPVPSRPHRPARHGCGRVARRSQRHVAQRSLAVGRRRHRGPTQQPR